MALLAYSEAGADTLDAVGRAAEPTLGGARAGPPARLIGPTGPRVANRAPNAPAAADPREGARLAAAFGALLPRRDGRVDRARRGGAERPRVNDSERVSTHWTS